MKHVFISYSRREIRFVEKLAKDLEAKGYDVWFDLTDIEGGDRWTQEIQKGIEASEYFILVVSLNSIISEWVEKEFLFASNRGLKIIPLLFDDCEAKFPFWLMDIQYIDMRVKRQYKENFEKIITIIGEEDTSPLLPPEKTGFAAHLKNPTALWIGGFLLLVLSLLVFFSLKPTWAPAEPTKTPTTAVTKNVPTETKSPTATAPATETDMPLTPTLTPEAAVIPSATPIPTEIIDERGAEMVLIPASKFWMGSNSGEQDERPMHLVTVSDFYMDRFEVTNAQYFECVLDDDACAQPKTTTYFFNSTYNNHPVVYVTWQDAVDFCEWRDARLPTEAEWEKAARGEERFVYPWGMQWNKAYANALGADDGYLETSPVTSFKDGLSPYGVYNMAGNVWEWVDGWYDVYPGGNDNASSYFGEIHRITRGGSWGDNKSNLFTYKRSDLNPLDKNNQIGFRCAKDLP